MQKLNELIFKVNKLLDQNKYEQAFNLVKKFRNDFYINLNYGDELDKLEKIIDKENYEYKNQQNYFTWTKEKLVDRLNKHFDIKMFEVLLENYGNELTQNDIDISINKVLLSDDDRYNEQTKIYILKNLATLKNDKLKINIYNQFTNENSQIGIDKIFNSYYDNTMKEIQKIFFKQPSSIKMSKEIVNKIAYKHLFQPVKKCSFKKLAIDIAKLIEFDNLKNKENIKDLQWLMDLIFKCSK